MATTSHVRLQPSHTFGNRGKALSQFQNVFTHETMTARLLISKQGCPKIEDHLRKSQNQVRPLSDTALARLESG